MSIAQSVQQVSSRFADAGNSTALIFRPPIGDELPALGWPFSTRFLRTAYTGPLIRVRRSSDDTERDFAVGGSTIAAAIAAIAAFVGGSDGFVTAWYDQSVNGRHLIQTDVALQPKIATAGVMEKVSGNPPFLFAGGFGARDLLSPVRPQTFTGPAPRRWRCSLQHTPASSV